MGFRILILLFPTQGKFCCLFLERLFRETRTEPDVNFEDDNLTCGVLITLEFRTLKASENLALKVLVDCFA